MRLLLRMNIRCWGFRGARLILRSPSVSLPAMSALVLIGERGTPRYCWTPVMSIVGIGCPKIHKWGCGLTIHIFLLPSRSIRREADLPSSPALTSKPLNLNSAAMSLSRYWRMPGVLAISAILSAKAPAFTLVSTDDKLKNNLYLPVFSTSLVILFVFLSYTCRQPTANSTSVGKLGRTQDVV